MRNIFTSLLLVSLMIMIGCVVSDTLDVESYDDYTQETDNDMSGYNGSGGPHWNPCSNPDVYMMESPDGIIYYVTMPALCNSEFNIDMGDPPPEENPQEKVDNPYDDNDNESAISHSNSQL